ncbi:DNA topoisomerase 1 [Exophiala dermatitidis]|uniref:DNA topoisomerase I n=2 Tax=Exophiala dermatitidis TaxID=5970 RepID=H6C7T7_EXODN|nr:DNA topoisomerase I [Exophiala dermatitidis NIH/UT8656]KAJ4525807.1 DNA topoisomerase 1 [Exophiala dermatitidis]EHY59729.1 DNA topoisomerase I [Exophiala dermatitidis NIH/UT8656]KAJ4527248.1 DNA topoisomerase 1 [Exophiala dermatitidis]KAJ4532975.1 DNA topoisomerase 1 [Exophiala dermatitidis]KAJ4538754.1 DNA topoisomerase 1 [Exophiala dermatitidis]
MASSGDDMPIAASRKSNGTNGVTNALSASKIPSTVDATMDREIPTNGEVMPGISMANGDVKVEDTPMTDGNDNVVNGAKRKARDSLTRPDYAEAESSDDDVPLSKKRKTTTAPADSDSDDAPLISKAKTNGKTVTNPPRVKASQIGESSDSDVPLGKKLAKQKQNIEKAAEKEAKQIRKDEKKEADKSKAKKAAPAKKVKKEESSDDDKPLAKRAPATASRRVKTESSTPVKKTSKSIKKEETADPEDEEDDDDEVKWWEDPTKGDGTNKWETLEHNGVVFPPPYQPLPEHVKMKYDGVPISLHPDAEEVAGFFGSMLNSTHNVENPTFQKNFFNDFKEILEKTGGATDAKTGKKIEIKEFAKCDFRPIFEHYEAERAAKKALPAAEKKALKAAKDEAEAPYMYCIWDGKKQKVGNFRVEPPGLFRGRGEHPKTGKVKTRVMPEQVTLNIGKEAKVPPPPEGHKWKEIKHDKQGTWLAMWQENINGNYKYVMLAANSDIKGQSDYKKFEKARELKKHIDRIRQDYRKDLKSELMADRQKATAMYLIDQFALRAGNEKGEDEADTVGCCSLKYEHITLRAPNTVIFDFLGKDSIRFHEEFEVDPQVFKNLKIFKKPPKKEGDDIFDRLTTTQLNNHLKNYMPGLTAKVFRTYNASYTMSKLLSEMRSEGSVAEKVKDFNDANRKVAILCNHKRTVAATHTNQMEKIGNRLKGLKYQQWRLKQMMLDIDPKIKKKKGAEYFALPEDLDEAWIQEHQAYLVEEQRNKIIKKFEKDNEKLQAEGQKPMKQKELDERLEAVKELEKKFKKENKTKKVEAEGKSPSIEKLEENIKKFDARIATMSVQAEDKENNKEVALGTSKINYIDPRLTVVFCKKFNVPIEKLFSKTLREKFEWAIKSVDENWTF